MKPIIIYGFSLITLYSITFALLCGLRLPDLVVSNFPENDILDTINSSTTDGNGAMSLYVVIVIYELFEDRSDRFISQT